MERLADDLFKHWPPGHPDAPHGIVGMTVSETTYGGQGTFRQARPSSSSPRSAPPIAPLLPTDPRRAAQLPAPTIVVPSTDRDGLKLRTVTVCNCLDFRGGRGRS